MADISKIQVPGSATQYNIKDAQARSDIATLNESLDDIRADLGTKALTEDSKIAILACFRNVTFLNDSGEYDALYSALYPDIGLVRIDAVFNQGSTVIYDGISLNDLKAYLTVTGYYNDATSRRITDYALSGTLVAGTSTITIMAGGKTATFNVTVTSSVIHLKTYVFAVGNNYIKLYENSSRACSVYAHGEHAYTKRSSAESLQDDYYPIPIPVGASSISVNMPNDLYVGVRVIHWDGTGYVGDYSSPWLDAVNSTIDVSSYNYGTYFISLSYKSGSAGTADMTNYDMSGVEIAVS